MIVKNNLTAANANRQQETSAAERAKSAEKLSSGTKINRGADDAANLAISEKMRRQIFSLVQASANAQDGISSIQTADGALDQVNDMLGRMNELAIQAGNETLSSEDRGKIESEMNALRSEIDRVAETTTFNDQKLLDGSFAEGKRLQVGADVSDENQINIVIGQMDWASISESGSAPISLQNNAEISAVLDSIQTAGQNVSNMRSDLGATQNRLESTVGNLRNVAENTTAAESSIRDTDMAAEMIRMSSRNIANQAALAMQAQANQSNRGVLGLLA